MSTIAVSMISAYFLTAGSDAEVIAGRALATVTFPTIQAIADTTIARTPTTAFDPIGLEGETIFFHLTLGTRDRQLSR